MDETINSIAEYRLIPEYLEKISEEGKIWLALAIVNILIADRQLVTEEKGFFKDAIMMIENDEIRGELIESIKNRESVELGELTTDPEYAGHFFFYWGWLLRQTGKSKTQKLICWAQFVANSAFPQKPQNKFCIG